MARSSFGSALLQTVQRDTLRSAASEQWTRERTLPAERGTIFDRNGDELALSIPASTIAVNPRQVEDPAGTAELFAQTLGLGARRQLELEAAMAAQDRGFVYVARQVDEEKAAQLAALRLAGVTIYREDRRMLPGGPRAAASSAGPTSTASAPPVSSASTTTSCAASRASPRSKWPPEATPSQVAST